MDKTFIFGHKNPDTDSICSAMALANLRSKLGEEVEATRLGELNKETESTWEKIEAVLRNGNQYSEYTAGRNVFSIEIEIR